MWYLAVGVVAVVGLGFVIYLRGILKGSRSIIYKEAEAERKKAARRIAEYVNQRKQAEAEAQEATRRREEVEHEVAKDRERAGSGDDAIGDLRKRLARLTGDRGDGGEAGGTSGN